MQQQSQHCRPVSITQQRFVHEYAASRMQHCSELRVMDAVQEIRLEDRGLSSIVREDIQFFTALKSLQLDNNRITDFSALGELPQLRKLSLSSNKLQTLPVVVNIGESAQEPFFALQSLDVSFNLLPVRSVFSQESGWARLPGLRELDLSGNNLRKLPDALGAFPSLRSLTLEYNGLASDCLKPLASLPALQELSLAHNKIDCIPDRISTRPGSFSKLQRIDLSFNYIRYATSPKGLPAKVSYSAPHQSSNHTNAATSC